jgi:hypothetical protein
MNTSDILFPEMNEKNQAALNDLGTQLKSAESKNDWMLCLGAGVSISAGLPNWYQLLAKISAQLIPFSPSDSDREKFISTLDGNRHTFLKKEERSLHGEYKSVFEMINVLESAEYIRNFLETSLSEPGKRVDRKQIDLYMNYLIQQVCKTDKKVEDLEDTTLGAVARLMKSGDTHLIHNAISYNYDNLLETYLRDVCQCGDEYVHSIVKKDELRDFGSRDGWSIYHVHGRIPVIEHEGEEMSESVILTESDYYLQEQINYSWTNILQSYAMLHSNLIFIGFSGTDYNFRRIIKYVDRDDSMPQGHNRYIFFSVDDIVQAVFHEEVEERHRKLKDCISEMNKDNSKYAYEKLFIDYLIRSQTAYWQKHHLKVIWSSHEQLYRDLDKLHDVPFKK